MTRSSIKIIYLTLLWTLTCPFLRCFSLLDPLNCIALLTSIQSLQALSLKVSKETYDKLNEAFDKNPDLLKQLIAQSGSSKSKLSLPSQESQFINGISNILPRYGGTGTYFIKNPVTVALPKETIINGQKYVLTNRLNLFKNFLKKAISPISSSFNYFKSLGQNQGVSQDILKLISNKLKNDDDNKNKKVEKKPEKPKKKSVKKKNIKNSTSGGSDTGGGSDAGSSSVTGGKSAGGGNDTVGSKSAGGGSGTSGSKIAGGDSGTAGSKSAGGDSGTGDDSGAEGGSRSGSGSGSGNGGDSGTGGSSGNGDDGDTSGSNSAGGGSSGED